MFSGKDKIFRTPLHSVSDFSSGGFAKQVFIVSKAPAVPGAHHDFLKKILAAVQINLEKDTLFAEIPVGEPLSLLPACKQKQAGHILVFGLAPEQLGVAAEIPLYQPRQFYGLYLLFADSLAELEPDRVKKGQLWQAMQHMFLED